MGTTIIFCVTVLLVTVAICATCLLVRLNESDEERLRAEIRKLKEENEKDKLFARDARQVIANYIDENKRLKALLEKRK